MKNISKVWPIKLKKLSLHKTLKPNGSAPSSPLSYWPGMARIRQLPLAGGLVFAGLVLTQVPPSPVSLLGQRSLRVEPIESTLWQTTGTVRQSIVELYRARRLLIQSAVVADTSTQAQAAASESGSSAVANSSNKTSGPDDSALPTGRPSASRGQAPQSGQGSGNTLPKPAAPPQASGQAQVPFDPRKTIDTNLEMRVAVAKNVSSLEVATSVDGFLMDLGGESYCNLPAQQSFLLQSQGAGMGFGGCQLSNTVWLEPGEGGYVYVGDKWFKGRVLLLKDGPGITAVNFVLMHDYLSSVVGSEMYVHWPLEALKAQAVAARSYALTHHVRHASRAYDLDNTQRYQAYLGIAKETNTTQAAVAATTGEFISYNNGIVESLYAASDDIVRAAHGGNGMSQTGAMELASMGYGYADILGNYYPGTALSRLVVK